MIILMVCNLTLSYLTQTDSNHDLRSPSLQETTPTSVVGG